MGFGGWCVGVLLGLIGGLVLLVWLCAFEFGCWCLVLLRLAAVWLFSDDFVFAC